MKAAVLHGVAQPIQIEDRSPLVAPTGHAVVRLKAASLNRRDVWIRLGQYAGLKFPVVLGSDGVGVVESVGEEGNQWVGTDVIINPALHWGRNQSVQDFKTFNILGLPVDGTFAEQVLIPIENLVERPVHLTDEEAAALPLAGLTAFRALTRRAQLKSGERVLVTGAGGGTATFAILFAKALGTEVYVTSGNREKIARAIALGAKGGVNYRDADWPAQLTEMANGFDVIIDSAMGDGLAHLIDLANPGGRIAFFGATAGNPPEVNARKIFWKQLSLLGTTMGSPADFGAMVAFVQEHQLRPVVDEVFALDQANTALDHMQNSQQFGKIVLKI